MIFSRCNVDYFVPIQSLEATLSISALDAPPLTVSNHSNKDVALCQAVLAMIDKSQGRCGQTLGPMSNGDVMQAMAAEGDMVKHIYFT